MKMNKKGLVLAILLALIAVTILSAFTGLVLAILGLPQSSELAINIAATICLTLLVLLGVCGMFVVDWGKSLRERWGLWLLFGLSCLFLFVVFAIGLTMTNIWDWFILAGSMLWAFLLVIELFSPHKTEPCETEE